MKTIMDWLGYCLVGWSLLSVACKNLAGLDGQGFEPEVGHD